MGRAKRLEIGGRGDQQRQCGTGGEWDPLKQSFVRKNGETRRGTRRPPERTAENGYCNPLGCEGDSLGVTAQGSMI